jgi:tetratricopeptide (TPR) repeat protein
MQRNSLERSSPMQLARQPGSPEGWIDPGQTMLDGPAREALRQAAASLDAAERRRRPHEMCAALAQVGRCYRDLRALSAAEDALGQALRWARASGSVDQQVELLCELADTACALAEELADDQPRSAHSARERARDRSYEATRLASAVADPHWEVTVLLRVSDALNRCGDHDDALGLATRALELMAAEGKASD